MRKWCRNQKVTLVGALIAATAAMLFTTQVALARHPYLVWVDGLIRQVEPKFREMSIWDYRSGTST